MRRIATISTTTLLLTLPVLAGGCVQQNKYDQLLMANKSLEEQLVNLEGERDVAKANLDTVRSQLGKATSELNALRTKYNLTEGDLAKLGSEYDALMKRVGGLDFGPLPEDMTAALQALAAQHPEMLTFDARRGMLRFASDFTFALGSADLTSSAASSLASLAKILNSPSASNFEVRVVGHTDNVPISRAETKAKHPTNWHLSAHRAISVGSALINSSVQPTRIQVAGCSEYRPVVTNAAKGGAAQNRRVEIFLLPMSDVTPAAVAPVTATARPKAASEEPMK